MSRRQTGICNWWFALGIVVAALPAGAAPQVIYDDLLRNGWDSWSWGAVNFGAASPTHSGAASISLGLTNWDGLSFHSPAVIQSATYPKLTFWVHGGTGSGQPITVIFELGVATQQSRPLTDFLPGGPVAGTWKSVEINFAAIGLASFDRVSFADAGSGTQPTIYFDDVALQDIVVPLVIAVDPAADRHAFSPWIFGVSGTPDPAHPPYTVYRWGGNRTSRYDWEHDVDNSAGDWFFTNYTAGDDPGTLPNGSSADLFVDAVRARGAEPLVTVPMLGWAPIDRVRRWGFSVAKYGLQQQTECTVTNNADWCNPDMGNGRLPNGSPIVGNDEEDTSRPVGTPFATGWLQHIASRVGSPAAGGVKFFALDNEPMLWSDTHRDVHPDPVDYAEIWSKTAAYAAAIKALGPGYELFGPVAWGWCAYFWSDADGCGVNGPDYQANGPYLEWYLQQVADYEQANGVRLVDWLDVHYYPQAGTDLTDDESEPLASLRLRTVKSLWDPTYADESWIGEPVQLIPRMKDIIARKKPGTKLAITEYNFGGDVTDAGLTAAMAQAEVLAVFARDGVDLAARWVTPVIGSRVEDAFELFLDYDGSGAAVAGDSVRATTTRKDEVTAYAFRSLSARLYVLLVNKSTALVTVPVTVAGGVTGPIPLWGFDGGQMLGSAGAATLTAGGFDVAMPARSVRLAVAQLPCALPGAVSGLRLAKTGLSQLRLTWTDLGGATSYAIYEDASPTGGFATLSGTATTGTTGLTIAAPSGARYYRVAARNGCGEGPP